MWITITNYVFMVGGFIFSLALLPSVFSKNKPHWRTSALTGGVLGVYCICYIGLQMWAALASGLLTILLWLVLLIQALRR